MIYVVTIVQGKRIFNFELDSFHNFPILQGRVLKVQVKDIKEENLWQRKRNLKR